MDRGRPNSRPEEKADVEVGGGFADDIFHPLAVPPPAVGRVIRRGNSDDPDLDLGPERFLEKQSAAPGMHRFCEHIELVRVKPVFVQVIA